MKKYRQIEINFYINLFDQMGHKITDGMVTHISINLYQELYDQLIFQLMEQINDEKT